MSKIVISNFSFQSSFYCIFLVRRPGVLLGQREEREGGREPNCLFCLYEMSSFNKVMKLPWAHVVIVSDWVTCSKHHFHISPFSSFLIKEQTYPTNPEVLIPNRQPLQWKFISAYVPFHYQLIVFGQQLDRCRGPNNRTVFIWNREMQPLRPTLAATSTKGWM